MRDTAIVFAVALASFWLVAVGWAWRHSTDATRIEPVRLEYRVDVNRADAATLQLLPGLGPTIAEHVLEHRNAGGRFNHPDDLQRVHRIGPVTAELIAPWIEFSTD